MTKASALLLALALATTACAEKSEPAATPAPSADSARIDDFALKTLDGVELRLSEALAKGPVILDFWATWCAPCKRAMPRWAEVQKTYADRGVQLWAMNWDDPRMHDRIAPYFEQNGFEFPCLLDDEKKVGTRLGVMNLPTLFVVAPDRTIAWHHVGYADGDERELVAILERLLAEGR